MRDDEVTRRSDERFARMRPFGGRTPPPVDTTGLPPGPSWPPLAQSAGLLRFRHRFVPHLHRRYGDVFTVRLVPHGRPLVLFTRPERDQGDLRGRPGGLPRGQGQRDPRPDHGGALAAAADGAEHKRARKLLMPAFNGQALQGYQDLVTGVAKTEVGSWTPGQPFRSLDRMNALTLEVILRVVFGVTDEDRLARLRPLVNATVDVSPAVLLGWGYPTAAARGHVEAHRRERRTPSTG